MKSTLVFMFLRLLLIGTFAVLCLQSLNIDSLFSRSVKSNTYKPAEIALSSNARVLSPDSKLSPHSSLYHLNSNNEIVAGSRVQHLAPIGGSGEIDVQPGNGGDGNAANSLSARPFHPLSSIFLSKFDSLSSQGLATSNNVSTGCVSASSNNASSIPSYPKQQPDVSDYLSLYDSRLLSSNPSDFFNISQAVKEPYDTVFNKTLSTLISDYNNPELCPRTKGWDANSLTYMKMIIEFWSKLAEEAEVPYMLTYGTLLGYARNMNYTPYDADMDIWVPSSAYKRLRKYADSPPFEFDDDKFHLFLHLEFEYVPANLQRRVDCRGYLVDSYTGLCSFVGNLGRLSFRSRHLDLFALDHLPEQNIVAIPENHIIIQSKPWVFFPMRPCTFFGVKVYCPNRYELVLRIFYGERVSDMLPSRYCKNGTFVTVHTDPDFHAMMLKKWKKKHGKAAIDDFYSIKDIYTWEKAEKFCEETTPKIDPRRYGWCNFPPTSAPDSTTSLSAVVGESIVPAMKSSNSNRKEKEVKVVARKLLLAASAGTTIDGTTSTYAGPVEVESGTEIENEA